MNMPLFSVLYNSNTKFTRDFSKSSKEISKIAQKIAKNYEDVILYSFYKSDNVSDLWLAKIKMVEINQITMGVCEYDKLCWCTISNSKNSAIKLQWIKRSLNIVLCLFCSIFSSSQCGLYLT